METKLLEKVSEVISAIKSVKQVDEKRKIFLVTHNQECKKKKKKNETWLSILATISCNFQFVNTHTHTHTHTHIYIYIYNMIKSLYYS